MEGAKMFFAGSPLRAWHPRTCGSSRNQENLVLWQSECDHGVSAPVNKRWDPTEFIEFLGILPHRERVQPCPFIAVPQKVAPVASVGEEKSLGCMSGEVTMVPPAEERAALSLRVNPRGTLPALGFPLINILHSGRPETKP